MGNARYLIAGVCIQKYGLTGEKKIDRKKDNVIKTI